MAKNGFTLIEFMVVVAVIGILAATSIPLYQNYVMRSQVATALAELNGARIQYELIVNNGGVGSDFTTDVMNFSNTSNVCIYKVYAPIAGLAEPALECELRNVTTSVKGQKVYLNRLANGKWQCSVPSAILDKYKPSGCI